MKNLISSLVSVVIFTLSLTTSAQYYSEVVKWELHLSSGEVVIGASSDMLRAKEAIKHFTSNSLETSVEILSFKMLYSTVRVEYRGQDPLTKLFNEVSEGYIVIPENVYSDLIQYNHRYSPITTFKLDETSTKGYTSSQNTLKTVIHYSIKNYPYSRDYKEYL